MLLLMASHSLLWLSSVPLGFPGGLEGKASARNTGDPCSIPESGRSPGEGNGNPLQYSCLENPMGGCSRWGHKESDTTKRLHFTSLQCPVVCLCHVFFIHSSVDGYLGCFHALAVMKSAAVSACILLNYSFIQIYAQE